MQVLFISEIIISLVSKKIILCELFIQMLQLEAIQVDPEAHFCIKLQKMWHRRTAGRLRQALDMFSNSLYRKPLYFFIYSFFGFIYSLRRLFGITLDVNVVLYIHRDVFSVLLSTTLEQRLENTVSEVSGQSAVHRLPSHEHTFYTTAVRVAVL